MKRLAAVATLGLAALALATCDSGPNAGAITFDLTSPFNSDGAIQFIATATAPDSIVGVTPACSGCQVFIARVSAGAVRGVVTGDITAGPLVHLGVTDVGNPSAYAMT